MVKIKSMFIGSEIFLELIILRGLNKFIEKFFFSD